VSYETLRLEKPEDGVAVVTLDRPQRLNAINGALLRELDALLGEIEKDDAVRAFLITGAPRPDGRPCFSAGFDLKSIGEGGRPERGLGQHVTDRLDDLSKPSIAVVDGICSTGGGELALAADLRLVGEQLELSDWHLKNLGIGLGEWGAATRWTRLVGAQKAKEVLLTGRVLGAAEAVSCGWALARHPSAALMGEALAMARAIARMNPVGVRATLLHVDHSEDMSRDQSLRWALELPRLVGMRTAIEERADAVLGKPSTARSEAQPSEAQGKPSTARSEAQPSEAKEQEN
jgi:enoyl-CoA hydratase/carnithine racemase